MNAPLDPRDLSEVYFLVDALASAPQKAVQLGRLTAEGAASARVTEAVKLLTDAFVRVQKNGVLRADWQNSILVELRERDVAIANAVEWAFRNRLNRRRGNQR